MKLATARRSAGIDVSVQTHVGAVRPRNEDSVDLAYVPLGAAGEGVLIVVADGMGGVAGGATASALTVQVILESLPELKEAFRAADAAWQRRVSAWLRTTVMRANAGVRQLAVDEPSLAGMGSTLLLGLIVDGWLGVVWVGDSRAYLLRGDTLAQLTRDHSWDVDRELEGIGSDPSVQESAYRGMLTSVIGRSEQTEVGVRWEALERDDLLVFASDGLTNYYHGEALATALATAADTDPAADSIAARLIEWANVAGGADNISVGIARIGSLSSRLPTPSQVTQSQVPHRAWRVAPTIAASTVRSREDSRPVGTRVAALAAAAAITLSVGAGAGALYMNDWRGSNNGATAAPIVGGSTARALASDASSSGYDSSGGTPSPAVTDSTERRVSAEGGMPPTQGVRAAAVAQTKAPVTTSRAATPPSTSVAATRNSGSGVLTDSSMRRSERLAESEPRPSATAPEVPSPSTLSPPPRGSKAPLDSSISEATPRKEATDGSAGCSFWRRATFRCKRPAATQPSPPTRKSVRSQPPPSASSISF